MNPRLLTILLLAALSDAAVAQPCVLGIYADEAGSDSHYQYIPQSIVDVHVVLHVESTVSGVAFTIQWPPTLFPSATSYGPNGLGLNVNGAGGMNVGLGECAIGFNSLPILVASYQVFQIAGPDVVISPGPNTDEHPSFPVYATCADQLVTCEGTSSLYSQQVSTESASIGSVKALYRD